MRQSNPGIVDLPGKPGQSVGNPESLFNNHKFVRLGSSEKLYDPSYGKIHDSIDDFENDYVDAYFRIHIGGAVLSESGVIDLNGDGDMDDVNVPVDLMLFMANPSGNQLEEM